MALSPVTIKGREATASTYSIRARSRPEGGSIGPARPSAPAHLSLPFPSFIAIKSSLRSMAEDRKLKSNVLRFLPKNCPVHRPCYRYRRNGSGRSGYEPLQLLHGAPAARAGEGLARFNHGGTRRSQ